MPLKQHEKNFLLLKESYSDVVKCRVMSYIISRSTRRRNGGVIKTEKFNNIDKMNYTTIDKNIKI